MNTQPSVTDIMGRLHHASCIIGYVSNNAIDRDEVELGETLKAAEMAVLKAIDELKELEV